MGKLFKAYVNLSADVKAERVETKDKFISDLERGEICVYGEYELGGISSDISIYSDKIVEGEMLITIESDMCHVVLSGKVEQEFDPEYFQDFIENSKYLNPPCLSSRYLCWLFTQIRNITFFFITIFI